MKIVITLEDGPSNTNLVEIDCATSIPNPTVEQLNASKAARIMLAFRQMLSNPNLGKVVEACLDIKWQ